MITTLRETECGTLQFTVAEWPAETVSANASARERCRPGGFISNGGQGPGALYQVLRSRVQAHYGVTARDLQSRRRTERLCDARAAIVWALREANPAPVSYRDIATLLSRRDHGTAMSLHHRADFRRGWDRVFKQFTDDLKLLLPS
jgi:hypothetical protein